MQAMEYADMLRLYNESRAALRYALKLDRPDLQTLIDVEVTRLRRLTAWLRRETLRAPALPDKSACRHYLAMHRKRLAQAHAAVQARTRPIWRYEQNVLFETHYVDLWKAKLAVAPKDAPKPRRVAPGLETKRRAGEPSPAALAVERIKAARRLESGQGLAHTRARV